MLSNSLKMIEIDRNMSRVLVDCVRKKHDFDIIASVGFIVFYFSNITYFDVITSLVSIRWGACTEKSDVIVQPSSPSRCCARNMVT